MRQRYARNVVTGITNGESDRVRAAKIMAKGQAGIVRRNPAGVRFSRSNADDVIPRASNVANNIL